MPTRKLITKSIAKSASTYVGETGELFYDTVTATLKISNGTTPGGATLSTDGSGGGSITLTNGAVIKDTADNAVAFGLAAGYSNQGASSIAIGINAGYTSQGNAAVAIGNNAGYTGQGVSAVAIGIQAGYTDQAANSIILNATGAQLNQTTANTFTVKPVRNGGSAAGMAAAGFRPTYYNPTTGEFVYASS